MKFYCLFDSFFSLKHVMTAHQIRISGYVYVLARKIFSLKIFKRKSRKKSHEFETGKSTSIQDFSQIFFFALGRKQCLPDFKITEKQAPKGFLPLSAMEGIGISRKSVTLSTLVDNRQKKYIFVVEYLQHIY